MQAISNDDYNDSVHGDDDGDYDDDDDDDDEGICSRNNCSIRSLSC